MLNEPDLTTLLRWAAGCTIRAQGSHRDGYLADAWDYLNRATQHIEDAKRLLVEQRRKNIKDNL